MGIIILVGAAYIADKFNKPFHIAIAYTLFSAIASAIGGAGIGEILISTVLIALFCIAYFLTLIKFSDNIASWLVILIGFPLALFLFPLAM